MKKKAYIQPELSIVTIQGGALLISASVDNGIVLTGDGDGNAEEGLARGGFFDDNDNQSNQDWW
jgi:hypothetical protein